jgi:hypothetical protein
MAERQGISNRETASEEAQERDQFPPANPEPDVEDAAGRIGEEPLPEMRDRQMSLKAGSRSIAQKEDKSRYPDRPEPPSNKVAGAFGKEKEKEG